MRDTLPHADLTAQMHPEGWVESLSPFTQGTRPQSFFCADRLVVSTIATSPQRRGRAISGRQDD